MSDNLINDIFSNKLNSKKKLLKSSDFIENADKYFGSIENKKITLENIKSKRFKKRKRFKTKTNRYDFNEKFIRTWDEKFKLLKEYNDQNGTTLIKEKDGYRKLYRFTILLKRLYEKNELPVKYIDQLDSINFKWHSAQRERYRNAWLVNYRQLLEVRDEYGTIKLAGLPITDKIKNLKRWVSRQRSYKHSNNHRLTQFRIDKLNSIGFDWKMPPPDMSRRELDGDDRWLDKMIRLSEYRKVHGNVNPSQSSKNKEIRNLGLWVNVQRVAKKRNTLSQDRIEALNEIGFIWDMERYKFMNRIDDLVDYKSKHGDYNMSSTFKGYNSLGNYVYKLKRTKSSLPEWKITELEKIGFTFIEEEDIKKKILIRKDWILKYETLLEIKDDEKDVNKPKVEWNNRRIGFWIYRQKRRFEKGLLNQRQIEMLENAGIIWKITSSNDRAWDEAYGMVLEFKKEYGHIRIGSDFDRSLNNWISRQRRDFKLNLLSKEKIELLKKISILE